MSQLSLPVIDRWWAGDAGRFIHISCWWASVARWSCVLHAASCLPRSLSTKPNVVINSTDVECFRLNSSARWHNWSDAISPAAWSQRDAISWSHGGKTCPRRVLQWLCLYMPCTAPWRAACDVCRCRGARLCRWPCIRHDVLWSTLFACNRAAWRCWFASRPVRVLGRTQRCLYKTRRRRWIEFLFDLVRSVVVLPCTFSCSEVWTIINVHHESHLNHIMYTDLLCLPVK